MKQRFDDILNESIQQLEASGGDVEAVLSRYPERAAELLPYLEVWTSLSAVERAQASSAGTMRARQQLLSAMARATEPERGVSSINSLASKGGLRMRFVSVKFVAVFVAGIALALGAMSLAGSLGSDGGPSVVAHSSECIEDLDFNDDGSLTVEDIDDLEDAIDDDNDADEDGIDDGIDTDDDGDGLDDAIDDDDDGDGVDDSVDDNEFDGDGDGDVDINDVVGSVGDFVACLQDDQPPAP